LKGRERGGVVEGPAKGRVLEGVASPPKQFGGKRNSIQAVSVKCGWKPRQPGGFLALVTPNCLSRAQKTKYGRRYVVLKTAIYPVAPSRPLSILPIPNPPEAVL